MAVVPDYHDAAELLIQEVMAEFCRDCRVCALRTKNGRDPNGILGCSCPDEEAEKMLEQVRAIKEHETIKHPIAV